MLHIFMPIGKSFAFFRKQKNLGSNLSKINTKLLFTKIFS